MSTNQTYDGAPRQPATITVVQTLLVLSAVGSAVGLIVSIYLVTVVLDLVTRFQTAFSGFGGAAAPQPELGAGSQVTVSIVLAVVETIAVVAVSLWAFRAVGQARAIARVVLATLTAAQVVLSVTSTLVAGAGIGLVVVAAVVGLLVFDAPVLFLLFVPAESRRWFTDASPTVTHGAANQTGPTPPWTPAAAGYPPPSAPFPAARPSGPFPQPPPQPPRHGPRPDAGGRHSAPRPP